LPVDRKAPIDIAWGESFAVDVASMPDEMLKELVGVLVADNVASGIDDVTCVLNELATLPGKLVKVDGRVVEKIGQERVDLRICGQASPPKSLKDAV
jgi:hypothetical protein